MKMRFPINLKVNGDNRRNKIKDVFVILGGVLLVKRKVVAEDLFEIISVTNPQIAPDGKEMVFVRTHMDEDENKYIANLFHVDFQTNEVTQWTHGQERISSPKWTLNGKFVAFLSNRDGSNQVYILPALGGEAKKLTSFPRGVSSFHWSPCGNKIWVNGPVKEGGKFTDKE